MLMLNVQWEGPSPNGLLAFPDKKWDQWDPHRQQRACVHPVGWDADGTQVRVGQRTGVRGRRTDIQGLGRVLHGVRPVTSECTAAASQQVALRLECIFRPSKQLRAAALARYTGVAGISLSDRFPVRHDSRACVAQAHTSFARAAAASTVAKATAPRIRSLLLMASSRVLA